MVELRLQTIRLTTRSSRRLPCHAPWLLNEVLEWKATSRQGRAKVAAAERESRWTDTGEKF